MIRKLKSGHYRLYSRKVDPRPAGAEISEPFDRAPAPKSTSGPFSSSNTADEEIASVRLRVTPPRPGGFLCRHTEDLGALGPDGLPRRGLSGRVRGAAPPLSRDAPEPLATLRRDLRAVTP